MDNEIKRAFDGIHADDALKARTKASVFSQLRHEKTQRRQNLRRAVAVCACALVIVAGLGGYFSYTTPVAAISIDTDSSVELDVNMFDRVIGVTGYDQNGSELSLDALKVKNLDYSEAVDIVLAMLDDENALVTVNCGSEQRCHRMQDCISQCSDHTLAVTYNESCADRDEAHDAGMSLGKYRVYLALNALEPDLTPEEARYMTMQELRELITEKSSAGGESCEPGTGHGYGAGQQPESSEHQSGEHEGEHNGNSGEAHGSGHGQGHKYGSGD